jgi:hypothetical protein
MKELVAPFRRLDAQKIIETVQALHARIERRFPGSGLSRVVAELQAVAEEAVERTKWIQEPHLPLRFVAAILSVAIIALFALMVTRIHQFDFHEYTNFIQALEASISSLVFIGAAIIFFISWENRIKRSRALKAIHELRALAHIVDMHQLTKDPESYFARGHTALTPAKRRMTPFELNRYLDYCGESLALMSKIAALYVQGFQDPVVLDAVDDMEDLTAGFSRKIWQKLTILEALGRSLEEPATSSPETDFIAQTQGGPREAQQGTTGA